MTDRILWNRRPDEGDMGGDIDEVVLRDVGVHIEQMDDNCWWIGIYKNYPDTVYWMGNFVVGPNGMEFKEQENNGIEWDKEASHDP